MNIILKMTNLFSKIFSIVILIYLCIVYFFGCETNYTVIAISCTIASTLLLWTRTNYNIYGVNAMVFYYMILSQFGYVFSLVLFGSEANTRMVYSNGIVRTDNFTIAIIISGLAVLLYSISATNGSHIKFKIREFKFSYFDKYEVCENFIFYSQISILLIQLVISITTQFLFGDMLYSQRTELLGEKYPIIMYIYYFSECAMPLIIATGSKRKIAVATMVYIPIVALQFLSGNRGEVMYGVLIIIAILSLKYKNAINVRRIIIFIVLSIIILPTIASVREGGTFSFNGFSSQLSAFLSELGFQIVPTTYTVDYIDNTHNYQFGATYLYDIVLRLAGILGCDTTSMRLSMAKVDNMLPDFGYGLGYSQVAESYYNFGLIGIGVEMFIISRLGLLFEKKIKDDIDGSLIIIYVCMAVNLVNITRNKFDSTFIFLVYSFLIYFCNKVISGRQRKRIANDVHSNVFMEK